MRVTIEGRQGAEAGQRGQRRGAARSDAAQLRLDATPTAAPEGGGPGSQFNAGVQLPGYTRAPRGRSAQAATWWPIPGDSVVVQFTTPRRQVLQLRGALRAREISGDIWFVSGSGASLQLGTFTAARQGR